MTAFPEKICIKRKRGDKDGGLEFLRFEDSGHKRSKTKVGSEEDWVYQRGSPGEVGTGKPLAEDTSSAFGAAAVSQLVQLPLIQASRPGDESRPIRPLRQKKTFTDPKAVPDTPPPAQLNNVCSVVRRFHLSIFKTSSSNITTQSPCRSRKRAAVFVERGEMKKKVRAISHSQPTDPLDSISSTQSVKDAPEAIAHIASAEYVATSAQLKRPGNRARTVTKSSLPPSFSKREEADMEQLAREMDAYTLEQVFQTLARIDEHKAREQRQTNAPKFRPKAPNQRFFERNPGYAVKLDKQTAAMDVETDVKDDEEYVMETYVRVPASCIYAEAPEKIGLLVFDSEPDKLEFFFGKELESEEEFLEDEDDENAENHYSADYPDEDLDWDDAFGRNPYNFLKQNAADTEECDETTYMDPAWDENADRTEEDRIFQELIGQYRSSGL